MRILSVMQRGPRVQVDFSNTVSKTKQSFAKEADINNIMARYLQTGILVAEPGKRHPQYGDFSQGEDYRDVCDRINKAKDAFMCLNSDTRAQFNNDPAEMFDFLADPENKEIAIDMGILPPELSTEPPEVVETTTTPPPVEPVEETPPPPVNPE